MRLLTILAVALAATAAAPANAVICYTLLDRSDTLLYRSSVPPFDMSDAGAAQRDALRRRNQYLMVAEVDSCQTVAAAAGTSGYHPATVDEIVAQMRGYLSYGGISAMPGVTGSGGAGGGGGGGGVQATPASGGGSSPMRGRY
ncbi:MAG TPA: hypothetical protein VG425_16830 [Casimicrobiaceae bacterium]|jgi:hypothetical protein|nr:hypothetical protein [Casimicrobiaceae bacterium]